MTVLRCTATVLSISFGILGGGGGGVSGGFTNYYSRVESLHDNNAVYTVLQTM